MNKNAILFAAAAACMSSGAAMAQSTDHRSERHEQNTRYEQSQRSDQHQRSDDRYDGHRGERRSDYRDHRGDYRDYRRRDGYYGYNGHNGHNGYNGYNGARGGSRYEMRRGGYLPTEYRGNRYVVSDWRRHRGLHAPQRGYHWVQAGNDYLLVAIATGLIANVLLNN